MNHSNIDKLSDVVDIIVNKVNPDKIILFGSRARGDFRDDSDYDLLVLKDNRGKRRFAAEIHSEFCNKGVMIPVDILVADTEKYSNRLSEMGFIYREINKDGVLIYERDERV